MYGHLYLYTISLHAVSLANAKPRLLLDCGERCRARPQIPISVCSGLRAFGFNTGVSGGGQFCVGRVAARKGALPDLNCVGRREVGYQLSFCAML